MPTLETANGRPVEVTPPDAEATNREFSRVMANDGPDAEQAPPKRQPKPAADPDAPKPRRGRPPKSEQARTTATPGPALNDGQRAQGVKGLAQLAAGLTLMAAKATGNAAFQADAVTIASNAEQIADACVQTAKADAKFAAALDKVCSAGPYAALISVAVGVGSQIARNHKPSLSIPGTVDPAELMQAQAGTEPASA